MITYHFSSGDTLEITGSSIVYRCPAGIAKIKPDNAQDKTNLIDIIVLRNGTVAIDPDCGDLSVRWRDGKASVALTLGTTYALYTVARSFRELIATLIDAALEYCSREGV